MRPKESTKNKKGKPASLHQKLMQMCGYSWIEHKKNIYFLKHHKVTFNNIVLQFILSIVYIQKPL